MRKRYAWSRGLILLGLTLLPANQAEHCRALFDRPMHAPFKPRGADRGEKSVLQDRRRQPWRRNHISRRARFRTLVEELGWAREKADAMARFREWIFLPRMGLHGQHVEGDGLIRDYHGNQHQLTA